MNSPRSPEGSTLITPLERFSAPAITLHWVIAALLLTNFYLGLNYEGLHGMAKFTILQLHKSIGFTVLLRLAFRLLGGGPPPHPDSMKPWEKTVATATHWLFYAFMLALPLSGWVIVSASPTNIPTLLYKTLPIPHLGFIHGLAMPLRRSIAGGTTRTHMIMAWTMIALVVLHVGAALKHHFWDRDSVLHRMIPMLKPRRA
jgi:cytochrome b561